jgi:carbamoyl-phosphate synthase large subunit
MAVIRSFKDLDAWQVAMKLTIEVYDVAKRLPATERFELAAQMRRAAVSIPSNVAEGQANAGGRYRHHVRIALGSWAELVTHLELLKILHLIDTAELAPMESQLERTGLLLHGLLRSLKEKAAANAG